MTDDLPAPSRRCPACGGGHYAAVPFCPFCGAPQDLPMAEPPPAAPRPEATAALESGLAPAPGPAAAPGPTPRAASPVPPVAQPRPAPPLTPPRPAPPRRPPPRSSAPPAPRPPAAPPRRFGLRQVVLAACAIAGLTVLALNRGGAPEAPRPVRVGPAWTAVALAPFRDTALLRLTGDGAFSLRLDGERVLRAAAAEGATVRPRELRSLELRAGRGEVTVTLTPRGR